MRGEERLDLANPVRLNGIKIDLITDLVQEGNVSPHLAETTAAGAATFGRKNTLNPIPFQHGLDRASAKPSDLTAACRYQRIGIEWQTLILRVLSHNQGNAKWSFASEVIFLCKPMKLQVQFIISHLCCFLFFRLVRYVHQWLEHMRCEMAHCWHNETVTGKVVGIIVIFGQVVGIRQTHQPRGFPRRE